MRRHSGLECCWYPNMDAGIRTQTEKVLGIEGAGVLAVGMLEGAWTDLKDILGVGAQEEGAWPWLRKISGME